MERRLIVAGERVGLSAMVREEFIARWDAFNDPELAALLTWQADGASPGACGRPPVTREQREEAWDAVATSHTIAPFDVRRVEDGRFIGEASLTGISWPSASAEIAVAILDPRDRRSGCGSETAVLLAAYGFDGLGLHRVTLRYLATNEAVVRGIERDGGAFGARVVGVEREAEWAYGGWQDAVLVEVLASDFPPHPATAHLRERTPVA
ncbi:MAG: GNAT family N-acetyltransferase [Actinomycetota bacterium]|nr:GNAT family N-acetyltransferase [Actinomycetota bacterium]